MTSLGYDVKNPLVFQILSNLDKSDKRNIDFEEFLDMMTARMVCFSYHSLFLSSHFAFFLINLLIFSSKICFGRLFLFACTPERQRLEGGHQQSVCPLRRQQHRLHHAGPLEARCKGAW
jgi:hypothetical protein